MSPRVHLVIDNCFASKRWTQPAEWAALVADLGVSLVEASADNECDPLYSDAGYLADWIAACKAAQADTGVSVANLYSGHGTYATLGLAHTDVRNRHRMQHQWLERMVDSAAALGAGLGFYTHAFNQAVLNDPPAYAAATDDLFTRLGEVAAYAASKGIRAAGVEQMYTPHQVPWTIAGARQLLKEVFARGRAAFYLSLDTGHQIGQKRFLRPSRQQLEYWSDERRAGRDWRGLWLGPPAAYDLLDESAAENGPARDKLLDDLETMLAQYDYLFAEAADGDLYEWARQLGCYCPIVHLQQTDGQRSAHWPFTPEHNARGIVHAEKLLEALAESYRQAHDPTLPPPCSDIYLTVEVFSSTLDTPKDIISRLEASVDYWRTYVPADGMTLD
ncbi:MAG: sugar phosphate isomerase/epimerase [Planctomycetaceae bacterium]|nr:sugar phosphate isomerase/epimerase [Planctomycetaceae bacterium]